MKYYGDFNNNHQMTVGELKKHLEKYTDDMRIYMEPSNAAYHGDSMWAQTLIDSYACDDVLKKKVALMLVGNPR